MRDCRRNCSKNLLNLFNLSIQKKSASRLAKNKNWKQIFLFNVKNSKHVEWSITFNICLVAVALASSSPSIEERSKREELFLVNWKGDRREINGEFLVNWRVMRFFNFWSVITASSLSTEERSKREELGCFDARRWERCNWKETAEREGITREIRRRRRLQIEKELGCSAHRRQFRVSCRFGLEREITSLFYI